MKNIVIAACVSALALVSSRSARADSFRKLPTETSGKPSALVVRVVGYAGNTNGAITVDVKNPTAEPHEFTAKGMYFVPTGNADEAPQRLGAVGPFQVLSANRARRERITVAAGATERLVLDVYCIDSHRASPSSSTSFHVAKDRVPEPLTKAIDASAARSAAGLGGVSAPAAKPAVQSEVWRNRDKNWVELDGEGKQEAAKRR